MQFGVLAASHAYNLTAVTLTSDEFSRVSLPVLRDALVKSVMSTIPTCSLSAVMGSNKRGSSLLVRLVSYPTIQLSSCPMLKLDAGQQGKARC